MTEQLTIARRLELAEAALNEGRIIQNDWRRPGAGGRELVCALREMRMTPQINYWPAGSSMKSVCGYWIVTVDRDVGVTPMFVSCRHCGGTASSRMLQGRPRMEPNP